MLLVRIIVQIWDTFMSQVLQEKQSISTKHRKLFNTIEFDNETITVELLSDVTFDLLKLYYHHSFR